MRTRVWSLFIAYALAAVMAAGLALARAPGRAVPVSAPLGGGARAVPPRWAAVRLGTQPWRTVGAWAAAAATWALGGYTPRADAALASVFPGLPPRERAPADATQE